MGKNHTDFKESLDELFLIEREKKEPPLYKVLLHNDDYTSMDFVVDILMAIFHKSYQEAKRIMLAVHNKGIGLCGIYPYDIAETKVKAVISHARANGFPLKASMEKE